MSAYDNWEQKLLAVGSHVRGPVLLAAYRDWTSGDLTDDEMRHLIAEWWTSCESWGDDLDAALEMLDSLAPTGEPLHGTDPYDHLIVYRATGGMKPDGGSWTLDRGVAERFADQIRSGRGRLLGMHSNAPVVWRGSVDPAGVLGYFTDRGERELVLPHGWVKNIEPEIEFA